MKARSALRAIGISFMLSGALGLTLNTVFVDYAYANNGKGGGGGNGGGGGGDSAGNSGDRGNSSHSNRGGNGKGKGNSNGKGNGKGKDGNDTVGASLKKFFGIKTKKPKQQAAKNATSKRKAVSKSKLARVGKQPTNVSMRPPTKGVRPSASQGSIASELKALNAAHASINGLTNAAPGSMPGLLNTYRTASIDEAEKVSALSAAVLQVEETKTAQTSAYTAVGIAQIKLDEAVAALDGVTEDDESFEQVTKNVEAAKADLDQAKEMAATAAQDLSDALEVETKALAEVDIAVEATKAAFEDLPGAQDLSDPALKELNDLLGLESNDDAPQPTDDSAQLVTGDETENSVF